MPIQKTRNETEVLPRVPSTITAGNKTVTTAGTRVQITTTATPCMYIIIVGKAANTGTIWVGDSSVANGTGIPLVALQSVRIDIDDISKIYIDSTVNSEGITYSFVI